MSSITVTGEILRQLSEAGERMEIRDADGRLIGIFEPGPSEKEEQALDWYRQRGWPMTISEYRNLQEETRALLSDPERLPPGRTTAEILATLKLLP